MIKEFLALMHSYGIPALVDLMADVAFIICVPFFIWFVIHKTRWYNLR